MEFSRQEQFDYLKEASESHARYGELLIEANRRHLEQSSHLTGLYEEMDKLTKSKSIVPPSDLFVELINSLISDAKDLVYKDTYLDRLKMFVPAGSNPSYPEMLMALRVLQQSLERFAAMLETEREKHTTIGVDEQTILAALQVAKADEESASYTDQDESDSDEEEEEDGGDEEDDVEADEEDDDADDEEDGVEADEEDESSEYQEYVRKNEVKRILRGKRIAEGWFNKYGDETFRFDLLDTHTIPIYEPPANGITFVKPER
jgi:hypothetical protein